MAQSGLGCVHYGSPYSVRQRVYEGARQLFLSNIDWYCISDKQQRSLSSCWLLLLLHGKQKKR
jgi:hypothetical protein